MAPCSALVHTPNRLVYPSSCSSSFQRSESIHRTSIGGTEQDWDSLSIRALRIATQPLVAPQPHQATQIIEICPCGTWKVDEALPTLGSPSGPARSSSQKKTDRQNQVQTVQPEEEHPWVGEIWCFLMLPI